jgi:sulfotransferase family protein
MKLIGAGLPRTGTLSQKVALEMLGIGPCYHMVNVLLDLDKTVVWRAAVDGQADWHEVFSGFEATVDWPGSFFTKELIEAFPEAKVLLSVRDGESWERSMRETIWGVFYGDSLMTDLSTARGRIDPAWAGYIELMMEMWRQSGLLGAGAGAEPGELAAAIERYNEEVIAAVPADRLLVWSVTDGWEPLCAFLEVDVPQAPFPNLNDSRQFAERIIDGALLSIKGWRDAEIAAAEARGELSAHH